MMIQHISACISTVALAFICITMLARANDLRFRHEWRYQLRLVGFILVGATPFGIVGVEIATKQPPNIYEAIFRLGIAFVFLTTPNQKPWWAWITRGDHQ